MKDLIKEILEKPDCPFYSCNVLFGLGFKDSIDRLAEYIASHLSFVLLKSKEDFE